MTAMVTRKAGPDGGIRAVTAAAEDLAAPAGWFGLVTIGNAFHRLPREAVAARLLRWLRPGGLLALVWGGSPDEPGPGGLTAWQQALVAVVRRWQAEAGRGRLPDDYARGRRDRPDTVILTRAGFAAAGRRAPAGHGVTPDRLRPITPTTMSTIEATFMTETDSSSRIIPMTAVPAAPMPVHTA